MRRNILWVVCVIAFGAQAEFAWSRKAPVNPPGKKSDIFLLIGQSNMAGVADIGVSDTVTLEHVYLFNDKNEWEKAKNTEKEGTNRYSTVKKTSLQKLSPGYTFARKIARYTGKEIGIVSNARGGTTILWWQKGYTGENDFNLYEEAVARAKAALAATPGAKIKGIIWHQGEGDNSKASAAYYMQRLKQLVNDLRTDLGDMTIPFIAGEVGKWNGRGLWVNPLIRQIPDSIACGAYVSSDGLTSIDSVKNNPHFDTYSQRVFGERYADKALELVYKMKPAGITVFSQPGYFGRSVLLPAGNYTAADLENMGIPVGDIASLRADKDYEATLFPGNFTGKAVKITGDEMQLDGIRISTIRVKSRR